MSTIQTRQAALIAVLMIAGIAFFVGDLHKEILKVLWPLLEAFWDTHIRIYERT